MTDTIETYCAGCGGRMTAAVPLASAFHDRICAALATPAGRTIWRDGDAVKRNTGRMNRRYDIELMDGTRILNARWRGKSNTKTSPRPGSAGAWIWTFDDRSLHLDMNRDYRSSAGRIKVMILRPAVCDCGHRFDDHSYRIQIDGRAGCLAAVGLARCGCLKGEDL